MDNKLNELSKPVAYSLRFRNMHTGEPDKTINANTTFSTLEKAKAYGLGSRYVTQDDGKIVSVRDPSQDPIVEPLYSQEYVSALLAELEAKDERIGELEVIATEYAGKFQKAQDANRHLIIMSNDDKRRITELQAKLGEMTTFRDNAVKKNKQRWDELLELRAKLATPVRLPALLPAPEDYASSILWAERDMHNATVRKCADANLAAAVNRLLDCDGTRGHFSAIRCSDAREEVERLLAQPVSSGYKLPEGWIACCERMPDADGAYWCWFGKEKPSVIQQRVCIWNDRNHEWCDSAVTHWMPLPAAPEGGK